MKRNGLLSFLVAGSLLIVLPGAAGAATFTVENTGDTGAGSLRDAIVQANGANGDDVINFNPAVFGSPQTIQLNNFLIIGPGAGADALTINGPGANLLTVEANDAGGEALNVTGGNNTIGGLAFLGHSTPQFTAVVNNDANLTLNQVVITGNTSDAGGNASGGGFINFGGNVTINSSTVSNNAVNNNGVNSGGGIVNAGNAATLSLFNTTISGNAVRGTGTEAGGAILNVGGGLRLDNATVAGNTVEHGGGGVFNDGGQVRLANALIASNTGDAGNDIVGADFTSQGHNLIGNSTGGTIAATNGDQFGTGANVIDPVLGALGDNGGTTPTMALLDGSPAINAGDPNNSDAAPPAPPALVPSLTTDQRGVARPQDGGNDIGAFELVSNEIDFGRVKRNTNNGTATLEVEVFALGELTLTGAGLRRPQAGPETKAKPVAGPGTYKLKVKPKGNKKKKLKKKGKVKVKAKVTFSPTNGVPNTETKKITLKLKD